MEDLEKKIRESYIEYILSHKKRPYSLENFMSAMNEDQATFYKFYNSFAEIDTTLWKEFFDVTLNSIQTGEEYEAFPVHDKVQVFYFTLFNVLQPFREYVIFCFEDSYFWEASPKCLSLFMQNFEFFAQDIVNEGMESGEIASRPFISDYYSKMMWGQTLLVLNTWAKDTSEDFDRSDATVEKATTFIFDVMSRGIFDSGFDLAKFLLSK